LIIGKLFVGKGIFIFSIGGCWSRQLATRSRAAFGIWMLQTHQSMPNPWPQSLLAVIGFFLLLLLLLGNALVN